MNMHFLNMGALQTEISEKSESIVEDRDIINVKTQEMLNEM